VVNGANPPSDSRIRAEFEAAGTGRPCAAGAGSLFLVAKVCRTVAKDFILAMPRSAASGKPGIADDPELRSSAAYR
jgi:hypothetical protein